MHEGRREDREERVSPIVKALIQLTDGKVLTYTIAPDTELGTRVVVDVDRFWVNPQGQTMKGVVVALTSGWDGPCKEARTIG